MLLNGAFEPRPQVQPQAAAAQSVEAPKLMSHKDTLAFIQEAGAALAAERAAAMQRAYDRDIAETVRVPLINRIAGELEALERKSPSTKRVYAADCKRFKEFCDAALTSVRPALPEVVCHFLLEQADNGASAATVDRLRAAISLAHRAAYCFDPTDDILVRATVQHIRRTAKGAKPKTGNAAQHPQDNAPESAANLTSQQTSHQPKGQ